MTGGTRVTPLFAWTSAVLLAACVMCEGVNLFPLSKWKAGAFLCSFSSNLCAKHPVHHNLTADNVHHSILSVVLYSQCEL